MEEGRASRRIGWDSVVVGKRNLMPWLRRDVDTQKIRDVKRNSGRPNNKAKAEHSREEERLAGKGHFSKPSSLSPLQTC